MPVITIKMEEHLWQITSISEIQLREMIKLFTVNIHAVSPDSQLSFLTLLSISLSSQSKLIDNH